MAEVTVQEVYSVTIQIDEAYPDDRHVRPRCVWFNTWTDASSAIERALTRLPHDSTTVMVSRERVDQFDNEESLDLDDWPADRHIVTGPMTAEDFT